jgi:hypothetical protein
VIAAWGYLHRSTHRLTSSFSAARSCSVALLHLCIVASACTYEAQHSAAGLAKRGAWLPSPSRAAVASLQRRAAAAGPPPTSTASAVASGELFMPTSLHSHKQQRRCYAESVCCKRMFQVFQMFQRYVASVLYGCCKSRSEYCILCCNDYTRMLQAYVPNVSSGFFLTYVASVFIWMLQMFHTYVASVLSGYCICFAMDLQVFLEFFCKCFRHMF